jgi:hypothetical protein
LEKARIVMMRGDSRRSSQIIFPERQASWQVSGAERLFVRAAGFDRVKIACLGH